MAFLVIGSPSSLHIFGNCEGYLGGISSGIDADNRQFDSCIAQASIILVELAPPYIRLAWEHKITAASVVYFEALPGGIRFNTDISLAFQEIMTQYYKVQTQTQGQIGYLDAAAITLNILRYIHSMENGSVTALEVGSWTGCSSYFIVRAMNTLTKQGTLFCLDTWQGNEYWNYEIASYIDIFANFRGFMTCYGTYKHIVPLVAASSDGFSIMQDNLFDIIFIDGDHRYAGVKADLLHALRKIKPGGLLIGHDCTAYAEELPQEFLSANLDKDCAFLNGQQYSCGVIKALQELLDQDYAIFDGSATWYKIVSVQDKQKGLLHSSM